jgi:YHS domain-containing protein
MKILLSAVVTLALTTGAAFAQNGTKPAPKAPGKAPAKVAKVKCAVMGDEFTPDAKSLKSVYKGKTYYFCCAGCKPAFDKDPAKYAKATPATPAKPAAPAKPAKKS